jgi:formate dehydrogenase subunit gamma
LLLSACCMWFRESFPACLRGMRHVFVFVQEGTPLITIGSFIIHSTCTLHGLFTVPGSTDAMVHGYVTDAWARSHHRLWYDRVIRKQTTGP